MEKSIENLWKEGFEAQGELTTPKVNDFYRQQSKIITQRFRRTQKWDTYLALPISVIFFFGFGEWLSYWIGGYTALIMLLMFAKGIRTMRKHKPLALGDDVYHYLTNYRNKLRRTIRNYTIGMVIGTPLLTLPAYYFIFFELSDKGTKALEKFGPWGFAGLVAGVSVFLSLWGFIAYRSAVGALYGRKIKALNRTIEDMEELQREG